MVATDVARVFLVDDHRVVRMGLRQLFEQTGRLSVAGEASSGEEALEKIPEMRPNLAIVDISMGGMDGIELTRRLKQTDPEVHVLIVSMHDDIYYVEEAFKAGANGYLLKDNAVDLMVEAVDAVLGGRRYLCSDMASKLN